MITRERLDQIEKFDSCFPFLVAEKNELVRGYREHLECLSESDKEVALAQACALATYVSEHAKGKMEAAARAFLSLPFAQLISKQLEASRVTKEETPESPRQG